MSPKPIEFDPNAPAVLLLERGSPILAQLRARYGMKLRALEHGAHVWVRIDGETMSGVMAALAPAAKRGRGRPVESGAIDALRDRFLVDEITRRRNAGEDAEMAQRGAERDLPRLVGKRKYRQLERDGLGTAPTTAKRAWAARGKVRSVLKVVPTDAPGRLDLVFDASPIPVNVRRKPNSFNKR